MKNLGLLLIAVGFLGGTLPTVMAEEGVLWGYFAAALGVGVVGVLLVRVGEQRQIEAVAATGGGVADLSGRLERVAAALARLNAEKADIDPYVLHTHIDADLRHDLAAFMADRERIGHTHGLQAYADVMSPLAAGERYLNRAWSASTDGYAEEAHTYLKRAEAQIDAARAELDRLGAQAR